MPQAIPYIIFAAKVAMTAYSAVTAVKALADGNIMGAVVAGFGAYMGASSLMSTGMSTAGGAAEGMAGVAEASEAGVLEGATTNLGDAASTSFDAAGATGVGSITPASGSMVSGLDAVGSLADVATAVEPTSFMGSIGQIGDTIGAGIKSVANNITDLGGDVTGLVSQGDGTFMNSLGQLFSENGEMLMKAGGAALNYMGEKEKQEMFREEQDKARKFGEKRADTYRRNVGAATRFTPSGNLMDVSNQGVLGA